MNIREIKGKTSKGETTKAIAVLLVVCLLASSFFSTGMFGETYADPVSGRIINFERGNPAYDTSVEPGTSLEKSGVPASLRAVVELESGYTFSQAQPQAGEDGDFDYYSYGYVIDKDAEAKYAAGERVLYTIYYADGSEAYRVYGSVNEGPEAFYACDQYGNLTGAVVSVPVEWTGSYNADAEGEYTLTAEVSGYSYNGESPTATIAVKHHESTGDGDHHCGNVDGEETRATCTCGLGNNDYSDQHDRMCDCFVAECTCPEGSFGHPNPDCPYYIPDADCDCGITSLAEPWFHNKGCELYREVTEDDCTCEGGAQNHDFGSDCILNATIYNFPILKSINGGGAMDTKMDNAMKGAITTSGSAARPASEFTGWQTIPSTWVDYVNTIWMNKAYNKFAWTTSANCSAQNNWAWGGGTATVTGTTTTTYNAKPVAASNIWTVYSGEQLLWALNNFTTGQTIRLGANINMNGNAYSWTTVNVGAKDLTIDGNNKTIFNLGIYYEGDRTNGTAVNRSSFIYNYRSLKVSNLTFKTAKFVTDEARVGLFRTTGSTTEIINTLNNVTVDSSMFCGLNEGGNVSTFGQMDASNGGTNRRKSVTKNCSAINGFLYGTDHINCFSTFGGGINASGNAGTSTVDNSFSANNLVCGTGGHSAGFQACSGEMLQFTNCFSSNEIYGSAAVGSFCGGIRSGYTNCFASGKLEGYVNLGGFGYSYGTSSGYTIPMIKSRILTNCYSTTLVGMRSSPQNQAGFMECMQENTTGTTPAYTEEFYNCYSAGEVGNFDLDMSNPQNVGGFFGRPENGWTFKATNCYYDKQTTAMREWVTGYSKTKAGVKGLLTSTTTKAGTGMASGSDFGLGTTNWVNSAQHYPQLKVFVDANATTWASAARANLAQAYSKASTATVFLDTWDTGYDWDANGVRTSSEVSYNRSTSETHKGAQYTYDTVREIVSDFSATSAAAWTELIAGGAPSSVIGGATTKDTIKIATGKGTVNNPGMNWFKASETVSGQTGFRPLRLIAYMDIEAGADQEIASGSYYNHREDVSLKMMNTLIDDLVVGLHDTKTWSTSKTGGYPTVSDTDDAFSDKYYAVPTDHTNNMLTEFTASKGAWLNTEIWRAKKNADGTYALDANGNYIPEYSVKVTGEGTGNNETIDEQKWNGEWPVYPDTSIGHKYIISYYWMLEDGRYRTDQKIITIINPGQYDLTINVYNNNDKSDNNTALYLAATEDSGSDMVYTYPSDTSNTATKPDNVYTSNVTAAWKKASDNTVINKGVLTMYSLDRTTIMGQAEFAGPVEAGQEITIPMTYFYLDYIDDPVQGLREVTSAAEDVEVVYTIMQDASGGYYLRFNKIANAPKGEISLIGDSSGIPADTLAYINDIQYHIQLDLYVSEISDFTLTKTLSEPAEEDEIFMFQIDYRGRGEEAGDVTNTVYAKVEIKAGESATTVSFKDMPVGWYTVTELDSNWRFTLDDNLADINPEATADAAHGSVTRWVGNN